MNSWPSPRQFTGSMRLPLWNCLALRQDVAVAIEQRDVYWQV
jgi:hypothetical protein